MKIEDELRALRDPERAKLLAGYFKTGKGEYGEGDVFLGLRVGDTRRIAKRHSELKMAEIRQLLGSRVHEHRLAALLILVHKYEKGDEKEKERVFSFYLKNAKRVNNWDLVDLSAPKIVGPHLIARKRAVLKKLAKSKNLWERRIAVLATFAFIREDDFDDAFRIAEILLEDRHDLIHKAVGWMLREIGKKDQKAEEKFLREHYRKMPRTMLRYAIERFDEKKRKYYMG